MPISSQESIFPEAFANRMRGLLGPSEYALFEESFRAPRTYGLRLNPSKISPEEFERIVPFPVTPIPFLPGGYFYDSDDRPSGCPLYHAGLYYLQDPAAMLPGSLLPVKPGDRVLDLCAAPGGKATAAGARLHGQGLIAANDISLPRTKALLRNMELFGIRNAFVSNEAPDTLESRFTGYFDAVLLDAPCSGEGMFRKDPSLLSDWSEEKSQALSVLQKRLLSQALSMLRPGGYLMYSTCTFAPAEDEEVIAGALKDHPEITLCDISRQDGFSSGLTDVRDGCRELARCVRIYPHRLRAEGHFLALLQKAPDPYFREQEDEGKALKEKRGKKKDTVSRISREAYGMVLDFMKEAGIRSIGSRAPELSLMEERGGKVYLLPEEGRADSDRFLGLHFLRNGLFLGELKKGRFEPAHPFALALGKEDISGGIRLSVKDERLIRYLKGEPIPISPEESNGKGWTFLCVEGFPLAFGKLTGGMLKNKIPAGWRIQ